MPLAPLSLSPTPMNFIVPEGSAAAAPITAPPQFGRVGHWRAEDLTNANISVPLSFVTTWPTAVVGGPDLTLVVDSGPQPPQCVVQGSDTFNSVLFYAVDDYLSAGQNLFELAAERTIFCVYKNFDTNIQCLCGQSGSGDSGETFEMLCGQDGYDPYYAGYDNDVSSIQLRSADWQWALMDYTSFDTVGQHLLTNRSATIFTGVESLATLPSDFTVGRSLLQGFQLNGFIAEIIVYNRLLSGAEVEILKAYCLNKYGIASL